MSVDKIAELIQLLDQLAEILGPGWTVGLVLGLLVAGLAWKAYNNRRLERGFKLALDEKERTVQRLADEARGWRILFLTHNLKITRQEAEKIIERNEFANPEEARRELESRRRFERRDRRRKKGRR